MRATPYTYAIAATRRWPAVLIDTATGQRRTLAGAEKPYYPYLSPDGSTVVVVDDHTELVFLSTVG